MIIACFQGSNAEDLRAAPEFTYSTSFNEHEGAEELSVRISNNEDERRFYLQFNMFIAEDAAGPWFNILLYHSDSARMNILFDSSLAFISGIDTVKLSTLPNYYDPYDNEGLPPFEQLVYPITGAERKEIAGMDSTTVIVVAGVKDELRVTFTAESWRKIRWFYGEVADEYN